MDKKACRRIGTLFVAFRLAENFLAKEAKVVIMKNK